MRARPTHPARWRPSLEELEPRNIPGVIAAAGPNANPPQNVLSPGITGLVAAVGTGDANNDNNQNPGNDGVGPNDKKNLLTIESSWVTGFTADITIAVANSAGTVPNKTSSVSEYQFEVNTVNSTGSAWINFSFLMGEGLGANFTAFTNGALTFDTPDSNPLPSITIPAGSPGGGRLTTVSQSSYNLTWTGGSVPAVSPPAQTTFIFHVDVPDWGFVPQAMAFGPGYVFVLRMTATPGVPPPQSALSERLLASESSATTSGPKVSHQPSDALVDRPASAPTIGAISSTVALWNSPADTHRVASHGSTEAGSSPWSNPPSRKDKDVPEVSPFVLDALDDSLTTS